MKLRDYQPSSKLKVGMFVTWKCDDYHYISYEGDGEEFKDDGLLVLLKTQENILEEISSDIGEELTLDTDIEHLLNIIKERPEFYSCSNDGDDFGVENWYEDGSLISEGDIVDNKYIYFESECECGNAKIGYLRWKNIENFE